MSNILFKIRTKTKKINTKSINLRNRQVTNITSNTFKDDINENVLITNNFIAYKSNNALTIINKSNNDISTIPLNSNNYFLSKQNNLVLIHSNNKVNIYDMQTKKRQDVDFTLTQPYFYEESNTLRLVNVNKNTLTSYKFNTNTNNFQLENEMSLNDQTKIIKIFIFENHVIGLSELNLFEWNIV